MKKIKNIILSLSLAIGLLVPALTLAPATVSAQIDPDDVAEACSGLSGDENANDCTGTAQNDVGRLIKVAVDILSWIVGIASVIMIVIAGFKFITSSGNAQSITSARHTLIYALVGVAVVAAAQILVNFVVGQID